MFAHKAFMDKHVLSSTIDCQGMRVGDDEGKGLSLKCIFLLT